jgi:hypothetical protein
MGPCIGRLTSVVSSRIVRTRCSQEYLVSLLTHLYLHEPGTRLAHRLFALGRPTRPAPAHSLHVWGRLESAEIISQVPIKSASFCGSRKALTCPSLCKQESKLAMRLGTKIASSIFAWPGDADGPSPVFQSEGLEDTHERSQSNSRAGRVARRSDSTPRINPCHRSPKPIPYPPSRGYSDRQMVVPKG